MLTKRVILGVSAAAIAALAVAGCSSSSTSSPSSSPTSPSASASSATVTVAGVELTLTDSSSLPSGWNSDIPVPTGASLTGSGTAEPVATTADHETLAVRYVSEDEAATVKSSLTKQFTSAGWTQDTAKAEYSLFTKGNESASFVVEPSAGTAGSTIYIWS